MDPFNEILLLQLLGATYNAIMNFVPMTVQTRKSLKRNFDDLFSPQELMRRIGRKTRGLTLGLTGRLAYNYALEPELTAEMLDNFTFQDYLDHVTSKNYLPTILRRAWIQGITDLIVCAALSQIDPGHKPPPGPNVQEESGL